MSDVLEDWEVTSLLSLETRFSSPVSPMLSALYADEFNRSDVVYLRDGQGHLVYERHPDHVSYRTVVVEQREGDGQNQIRLRVRDRGVPVIPDHIVDRLEASRHSGKLVHRVQSAPHLGHGEWPGVRRHGVHGQRQPQLGVLACIECQAQRMGRLR